MLPATARHPPTTSSLEVALLGGATSGKALARRGRWPDPASIDGRKCFTAPTSAARCRRREEAPIRRRWRVRRLVKSVVAGGAIVVSGLAHGVDTIAHTEAMAQGGRTIAVVGTP